MRIEKLEFNKIKVTVFPVDLNDMNISIKSLRPDSPQLHTFLFNIMEKVKKETGFNPYNGKIVVEAFPNGDCVELTVTKLTEPREVKKTAHKPGNVKAVLKKQPSKILYSFKCFEDLCKCLMVLSDNLHSDSAYYTIEGNHILSLPDTGAEQLYILREFALQRDRGKLCDSFLSEHATLVAKGERLSNMAKEIVKLYK